MTNTLVEGIARESHRISAGRQRDRKCPRALSNLFSCEEDAFGTKQFKERAQVEALLGEQKWSRAEMKRLNE